MGEKCEACKGEGTIPTVVQVGRLEWQEDWKCARCGGTGKEPPTDKGEGNG